MRILHRIILAVLIVSSASALAQSSATATVATSDGLTRITFPTARGSIIVNLPDDLRPGDTISGTVVVEPAGSTPDEKAGNKAVLDTCILNLAGTQVPVDTPFFNWKVGKGELGDWKPQFRIEILPPIGPGRLILQGLVDGGLPPGNTPSGAVITPDPKITPSSPTPPDASPQGFTWGPSNPAPKVIPLTESGAVVTPDPKITPQLTASGAVVTPNPKITPQPVPLEKPVETQMTGLQMTGAPPTLPGHTPSGAVITPDPKITPAPKVIPLTQSGAVVTPDPKISPQLLPSGAVITPDPKTTPTPTGYHLPAIGQQGHPIQVIGPFDPNGTTPRLFLLPVQPPITQDSAAPVPVPAPLEVLAQSPRKAVFASPSTTGPIQLQLQQGTNLISSPYRSIGINLTAPKTNLTKGEKTTLKVEVSGLQGIHDPVPIVLNNTGTVALQGGNTQTISIQPKHVSSSGTTSFTRTITGIQAGGFTVNAVIPSASTVPASPTSTGKPPS